MKIFGYTMSIALVLLLFFAKCGLMQQNESSHKQKPVIAFLGNSLTAWNNWQDAFPECQVYNFGIPGDHTSGMFRRLDTIIELQPDQLFIMGGINDLGAGFSPRVIIQTYRKMLEKISLELPRTQVYVQQVLPYRPSMFNNPAMNPGEIVRLNGMLEQWAHHYHCTYVLLHDRFTDDQGYLQSNLTKDGLHLNARGYAIWAKKLQPFAACSKE